MRQLMLLLVLLAPVALVVGGGWVVSAPTFFRGWDERIEKLKEGE